MDGSASCLLLLFLLAHGSASPAALPASMTLCQAETPDGAGATRPEPAYRFTPARPPGKKPLAQPVSWSLNRP